MKRYVKTPVFITIVSVLLAALMVVSIISVVYNNKINKLENRVTAAIALHDKEKAYFEEIKQQNSAIKEENDLLLKENNDLKFKLQEYANELSQANKLLGKMDQKKLIAAEKELAAEISPQSKTEPTDKVCYLTFDDGPSDRTPEILDILERYEVPATFFVVGTAKLQYLPRIVEKGHAIGLHSDTHNYASIYKSTDLYFKDLNALSDKIYEKIGVHPKIMRFPGGGSNGVSKSYNKGIMTRLTSQVRIKGYAYFDWNVDSTDASGQNVPKEQIVNSVLNAAAKKNSICVLMHDTSSKNSTVEALTEIIVGLEKMGYRFASLDESCYGYHHTVKN